MDTRFSPLLFRLDPERAHSLALALIRLAGRLPPAAGWLRRLYRTPDCPVEVAGLHFRNPVGLAAGYDKDALAWRGLAALGFGHIEVGTVTLRPQTGNPRPRVFRLPQDRALINRMGFPSRGADFVVQQLRDKRRDGLILGVNIGKNLDTPVRAALDDYLALVQRFALLADYLAINISSPNTPGLRALQSERLLADLLTPLQAARRAAEGRRRRKLPLFVKLAPDLDEADLESALNVIGVTGLDGVIATNTSTRRPPLKSRHAAEAGGLSGAPLLPLSLSFVEKVARLAQGALTVVAAGGIMDAAGARRYLNAGASLVQIYTGLVYAGPGLVRKIVEGLHR